MAYAGALCLLQTYKMQKTDSDYKLMSYQNEIADAAYDATALADLYSSKKSDIRNIFKKCDNDDGIIQGKDADGNPITSTHTYIDDQYKAEYVIDEGEEGYGTYSDAMADLTDWYNHVLAEVNADEQEWKSKLEKEQVTNAMLQTNIENFEQMVQNNIESAHTYGSGGN